MQPGQGEFQDAGAGRLDRARTAVLIVGACVVAGALTAGFLDLVSPSSHSHQAGSKPHVAAAAIPSTTNPAAQRVPDLQALLTRRATAVLAKDKAGWLATVDPSSTAFAAQEAKVFDNLSGLTFTRWTYEFAGTAPALGPSRLQDLGTKDAWVARVVLVYRLAGAASGDVRREQYLTLVRRHGDWLITTDTDGGTARDLWDLGPVHQVTGAASIVIGTADAASLPRYATEVDAAAQRVSAVWGSAWPRPVLVEVPRSQSEMATLLDRSDAAGLDQIAAVTTGEVGAGNSTSADRVLINPDGFAKLGPLGRRVVLTHELTHVATRGSTKADVPIWLSEGFADYIGYLGTGVSRTVIAQDEVDQVRAGHLPTGLPVEGDFDPTRTTIAPAYSGAWVACDLISRTYGQAKLVALYRTTAVDQSGATPTDDAQTRLEAAFHSVLGTDEATFVAAWQAELRRLAARG